MDTLPVRWWPRFDRSVAELPQFDQSGFVVCKRGTVHTNVSLFPYSVLLVSCEI